MSQSNVPLGPDAIIVGPAMPDRIRHLPDLSRIDQMLWLEIELTYYAAHTSVFLASDTPRARTDRSGIDLKR